MRDSEIKTLSITKGALFVSRRKTSRSEQLSAAKACTEGRIGIAEAARRLKIAKSTVQEWVELYRAHGDAAFTETAKNRSYSNELKVAAVKDYLSGNGSIRKITAKYSISSSRVLRSWIKVYNSGKDFGRKMSGGSRMKNTRQTTQEERIEIAKACLESGNHYGEIALKYNVSYQQVRSWTMKFKEKGPSGLEDRRGKRLAEQEPRTPEEEMRIRIAQLEHENYMLRMERDLLKKVKELEGRNAFQK